MRCAVAAPARAVRRTSRGAERGALAGARAGPKPGARAAARLHGHVCVCVLIVQVELLSLGRPGHRVPCALTPAPSGAVTRQTCASAAKTVVARADEDPRSGGHWPRDLRAPMSHSATGAPSVAETTKTLPSVDTATSVVHEHRCLEEFGPGGRSPVLQSATGRVAEDEPRSSATQKFAPTTTTGA